VEKLEELEVLEQQETQDLGVIQEVRGKLVLEEQQVYPGF